LLLFTFGNIVDRWVGWISELLFWTAWTDSLKWFELIKDVNSSRSMFRSSSLHRIRFIHQGRLLNRGFSYDIKQAGSLLVHCHDIKLRW